jgi:hypothetical protein
MTRDEFIATLPEDMRTEIAGLGVPDEVINRMAGVDDKKRKGAVALMLSNARKHGGPRRIRGEVISLFIKAAIDEYGAWKPGSNRDAQWQQVAWAIRKLDPEGTIALWCGLGDLYKSLPPDPKAKTEQPPTPPPPAVIVETKKSRQKQQGKRH